MIRRADRHCLRIAWAEPKSRVAGGLRKTQSVIPFSCTGKTHEREFRSLLLTVATDSYWFSLVCGVVTYVRNACFEDHFAQMMRHLLCADLARSKAFFEAWNKRSLLSFSWRWTVGCRVPPSPQPCGAVGNEWSNKKPGACSRRRSGQGWRAPALLARRLFERRAIF